MRFIQSFYCIRAFRFIFLRYFNSTIFPVQFSYSDYQFCQLLLVNFYENVKIVWSQEKPRWKFGSFFKFLDVNFAFCVISITTIIRIYNFRFPIETDYIEHAVTWVLVFFCQICAEFIYRLIFIRFFLFSVDYISLFPFTSSIIFLTLLVLSFHWQIFCIYFCSLGTLCVRCISPVWCCFPDAAVTILLLALIWLCKHDFSAIAYHQRAKRLKRSFFFSACMLRPISQQPNSGNL